MRACHPLAVALTLAALPVSGCRDQPRAPPPAAGSARPTFALPLADGPSPAAPLAPTVDALPHASSPLSVILAEGPERYRLIDQALAASEAFARSPPDYVVRYNGTPVSVWRADNGWIRAVEGLAGGERAYFYRALTEQPYLIAGPGAAFGYDRGELAAAYDGEGLALDSMDAARRVVAAARLLDRGRALHAAIIQGKREPAHAWDWRLVSAGADQQWLYWRQSLGEQADWRAWHDGQTADRGDRWAAEQQQRLAYAAALSAMSKAKPPRPHREAKPAVALAAAPAKAAEPPPPTEHPRPAAVPPALPAAPIETSRPATPPAAAAKSAGASKCAVTAKAKRKPAKSRKRLRRHASQHAAAKPARVEQPDKIEEPARDEAPVKSRRRNRTPKFLRDVGKFFDRTFGGSRVRVHRNSEPPDKE